MNGTVIALTVFDDNGPAFYAGGGGFTTAGGVSANNIAKWDGASNVGAVWWVGPENPVNPSVHLLVSQSFRKESTNWANPVHAGDCEVVPEARYGVRAVDVGSGSESAELLVATTLFAGASSSWWGDCVGPPKLRSTQLRAQLLGHGADPFRLRRLPLQGLRSGRLPVEAAED